MWRGYYTLPWEVMRVERCIIANMNFSLAEALRVHSSPCIAFIGSGGKTTAMFQLAGTLSRRADGQSRVEAKDEKSSPVIVTATSHLGARQL